MTIPTDQRTRGVWLAVLVASVMVVVSVLLLALAGPVTVLPEDILGEREAGAADAVFLIAALLLALAVPFVLARLTGQYRWMVSGALGFVAGLAAMVVLGNLLPGVLGAATTLLTLGLGVVGAVAMRVPPPASAVVGFRLGAILVAVALSVLLGRAEVLDPMPLLVLPLLALAGTLSDGNRPSSEPGEGPPRLRLDAVDGRDA